MLNLITKKFGDKLRKQNHWVGFWGIIIGIVIAVLGVYFSKQSGEISLHFKTVRVAQAGVPSVRILDERGQVISTDVFALELVVWNSGDFSLGSGSDRVRQPLTIALADGANILGVNVQDAKNVEPSAVQLRTLDDKKRVQIGWVQFDPGDAFKIAVVYAAKAQSEVSYAGRIVGGQIVNLSQFRDVNPNASFIATFFHSFLYDLENRPKLLAAALLAFVVQLGLLVAILRRKKPNFALGGVFVVVSLIAFAITQIPRWGTWPPL